MTPSTIEIVVDGDDVTDRVVYQQTTFQSQANPVQGDFKVTLRDPDRDYAVTAGSRISCHIDGVPLFGGFVMRIGRTHFLPVVDTNVIADVRSRAWNLSGPDYNILFDKRILRDLSNPAASLEIPAGSRTVSAAFHYLMDNFISAVPGLDTTTHVDSVSTEIGSEENGGLYVGQGKTWRDQMEDFADQSGVIYYIDADLAVNLHEYESVRSPWAFVDRLPNGVTTVGFREGTYEQDFMRVATEALVWGGSTIRGPQGPAGDIVFARYPDPPADDAREQDAIDRLALYGRWQYAEEHAGENNYLTQSSVDKRAKVIIGGVPGVVPTHGIEGGFSAPLDIVNLSWFAHDVPGGQHIRPGYLQDFIFYTQGNPGPVALTLPCRSMRVSFPTLPTDNPGGQTYVRFDGEFGTSYSDSRHLWRYLRGLRRRAGRAGVVVDNQSASAPAGSLATVWPLEAADGSRTSFTYPFTFFADQFDLYLNGLFQRPSIDYSYDPGTKQVTFSAAPDTGDQQWATGYVSQ
jgi:hypothetical protein